MLNHQNAHAVFVTDAKDATQFGRRVLKTKADRQDWQYGVKAVNPNSIEAGHNLPVKFFGVSSPVLKSKQVLICCGSSAKLCQVVHPGAPPSYC